MGSIPNLSPKCALRPEGSRQEAEPMAKKPRHARAHNTPGNQDDLNKDAQVNLVKIIELVPLARLKPWARNARTHSKKQIRQIAKSIETFGFTNPALIDAADMILAGHGRVEAAKLLGMDAIPCVRLEHMTQGQKRAYIIADNKLAENAGWDQDLLAQEFEALMGLDLGFDLTLTGFSFPEVDHVIASRAPEEPGNPDDDALLKPTAIARRCEPGDIWQLGRHRLICGDARDPITIAALMDGELARVVITDPPYNVKIEGNVGGLGKIQHQDFAMASGEMSEPEFVEFLRASFQNLARFSHDGSIHFIFMDWRHMVEVETAAREIYSELKNLIIWAKDNGGMGTFYRSRHELIFVYKNGTAPHINTFELGQHGRYRTNVWEYRGVNTLKANRPEELALHPTVKPVQMLADAILDVSGRGDVVLDLFGGSGSTLIAAHKTGRRAYLSEYDPVYCDRILARYEAFAHDEAELIACGMSPTGTRKGGTQ